MPRIIGITGNIACGKTAVGHILLELGAQRYIDTDALVHQLYLRGQPIALAVAQEFGPTVLAPDGSVDRKALGAIVFQNPQAMQRLEATVHPAVSLAIVNQLATVTSSGIAIIDAVKLLESGSAAYCHSKWLITCPQQQQLARLIARNTLTEEEALARIRAQPPVANRLPLVDEIIDNSSTLDNTHRQVSAAFARFLQRFPT